MTSNESNNTSRQARFDERKFRYENDKKEISNFLNTKNIIKTVVKLLFGNNEESTATSRQVLSVLVKVLDMFRNSFGQRARSAGSRGIRDAIDDATIAGVSMLRGFVKSVLSKDEECSRRYLCESSKIAAREGRELGYLISQFGGYASSYLLEHQKATPFNSSYEAIKKGRGGEDCAKLYQTCNETD
ncbi:secreted protein-like protein [Dinothrombium tinctorium]|uniref:Secreted protein-like protein n=1 Tax=Dinothrombium tinctorium TaxID=1965070 RepID=A0A3S4R787_9ACAR|nr:secreted protein-like protein [Dinothrombium tinctorium]RWS05199.1 secreted protein-like protein [Dinothrombium tinctorium]RWS12480.1 secreted protein-like protein [Dinothrombium tinctorium]